MSGYQVKLPVFEGPFDLLYHLIEEQKINIYDIPIAHIAAQYLEYLQMMEILDMEVASGFLIMAATLLEIKSKMLLPREKPEEMSSGDLDIDEGFFEEDARASLVEKLLEYKKFKLVALELREMERGASRIFTRSTDLERQPEEILEINVGPGELLSIYHALVRRRISPPIHRVVLEKIGIIDRINEIRALLKTIKGEMTFDRLVKKSTSRFETVLSFMAVLEMTKTGELNPIQKGNLQPILLRLAKPGTRPEKSEVEGLPEDQPDSFSEEIVNYASGDSDE
ncbi:MAG: segregation/condensation protein A [Candidatus Riflebacteria bacterium HGW-Riflebacteria-1]|jgi:segregation and condensation protein A|nr:MAG: segregation/condensation protein A [Candidatus Riflebacteria bacterium HGW-Riflebacteria-1]